MCLDQTTGESSGVDSVFTGLDPTSKVLDSRLPAGF
jgi:hypothetical protein